MALATYTNPNVANDIITYTVIDTGVGSGPFDRPATRTPPGGNVSVPVASDYGVRTLVAVRPNCFEPPSYSAVIDPGLIVNG